MVHSVILTTSVRLDRVIVIGKLFRVLFLINCLLWHKIHMILLLITVNSLQVQATHVLGLISTFKVSSVCSHLCRQLVWWLLLRCLIWPQIQSISDFIWKTLWPVQNNIRTSKPLSGGGRGRGGSEYGEAIYHVFKPWFMKIKYYHFL